jgi:hypothetical protein
MHVVCLRLHMSCHVFACVWNVRKHFQSDCFAVTSSSLLMRLSHMTVLMRPMLHSPTGLGETSFYRSSLNELPCSSNDSQSDESDSEGSPSDATRDCSPQDAAVILSQSQAPGTRDAVCEGTAQTAGPVPAMSLMDGVPRPPGSVGHAPTLRSHQASTSTATLIIPWEAPASLKEVPLQQPVKSSPPAGLNLPAAFLSLAAGLAVLLILPRPDTITQQSWNLLSVFVCGVAGACGLVILVNSPREGPRPLGPGCLDCLLCDENVGEAVERVIFGDLLTHAVWMWMQVSFSSLCPLAHGRCAACACCCSPRP